MQTFFNFCYASEEYNRACKLNNFEAGSNFGIRYKYGIGLPQNYFIDAEAQVAVKPKFERVK